MNSRAAQTYGLAMLFASIMALALPSCSKPDKSNKDSEQTEQQKTAPIMRKYDLAIEIPHTQCKLIADTALEAYDNILIHNIDIISSDNRVLWSDTNYYYIEDNYRTNIPGMCKTISSTGSDPVDYIFIKLLKNCFENYDTWLLHYDGINITQSAWVCADTILDVNHDGVLDVVGRDLIEAVCMDCDSFYYNPYMVYSLGKKLVENDTLEEQLAKLIYGSYIGNRKSYTVFKCPKYDIDVFTLWRLKHDFNGIHYRDCYSAEYARGIEDHGAYRRKVRFADCTAYICDGLAMYDNDSPFVLLYNNNDSLVDYIWLKVYYVEDANEDSVYTYDQSFTFDTTNATMQVEIRRLFSLLSNDTIWKLPTDSAYMTHYFHLDSTGIHYTHSDTALHFTNAALYEDFFTVFDPAKKHLND